MTPGDWPGGRVVYADTADWTDIATPDFRPSVSAVRIAIAENDVALKRWV
jgi:hypothetical protein